MIVRARSRALTSFGLYGEEDETWTLSSRMKALYNRWKLVLGSTAVVLTTGVSLSSPASASQIELNVKGEYSSAVKDQEHGPGTRLRTFNTDILIEEGGKIELPYFTESEFGSLGIKSEKKYENRI